MHRGQPAKLYFHRDRSDLFLGHRDKRPIGRRFHPSRVTLYLFPVKNGCVLTWCHRSGNNGFTDFNIFKDNKHKMFTDPNGNACNSIYYCLDVSPLPSFHNQYVLTEYIGINGHSWTTASPEVARPCVKEIDKSQYGFCDVSFHSARLPESLFWDVLSRRG